MLTWQLTPECLTPPLLLPPPPLLQPELSRLLYPVFVHCYLALVEKGATGLASNLMDKYKRRLDDMAARPARWGVCAVRCGAVRCGAVRCGAVRCGAVLGGAVLGGAVQCWALCCGWYSVVLSSCSASHYSSKCCA